MAKKFLPTYSLRVNYTYFFFRPLIPAIWSFACKGNVAEE